MRDWGIWSRALADARRNCESLQWPVMASLRELVGKRIPDDHCRQVNSYYYLKEALTGPDAPDLVVDLGCGNGASAAFAREVKPDVKWVGVDIMDSTSAKAITDDRVVLYDGVNLPFADGSLPIVFTNQVMEHVRHPEALLRDIKRVLAPGGAFVGSTSQLEPFHAWSLWNFTIYGFQVIVEDAGLVLEEVRPGIDGISLVQRQWFGRREEHRNWFKQSPLNLEIDQWGAATSQSAALVNLKKLQYAGQFSFRVRKPGGRSVPAGATKSAAAKAVAAPATPVSTMRPLGAPLAIEPRRRARVALGVRARVGRLVRLARRG
jgi:SAM-dependent methyltransferase